MHLNSNQNTGSDEPDRSQGEHVSLSLSNRPSYVAPVRPTMSETTALGVAMAAGAAEGVGVWSLSPGQLPHVTSERYEPQINPEGKTVRVKSLQWDHMTYMTQDIQHIIEHRAGWPRVLVNVMQHYVI